MNGYDLVLEALLSKVISTDPVFGEIRESRLKKGHYYCDYPAKKLGYPGKDTFITFNDIPGDKTRKNFLNLLKNLKRTIQQAKIMAKRHSKKWVNQLSKEEMKEVHMDIDDISNTVPHIHFNKTNEIEVIFIGELLGGRTELVIKNGRLTQAYYIGG